MIPISNGLEAGGGGGGATLINISVSNGDLECVSRRCLGQNSVINIS